MILVTGIIDLLLSVFGTTLLLGLRYGFDNIDQMSKEALKEAADSVMPFVRAWKIGSHARMILLIPIVLLFSYNRRHKNQKVDSYITIGGIVLAVIVGIEGIYQGLVMNLPILRNMILEMLEQIEQFGQFFM